MFPHKIQLMKPLLFSPFIIGVLFFLHSCQQTPNVILIMADDMGAECLSAYGGTSYVTPSLDAISKEGLLVSHCISQPLCTPSRVKLMTGMSNARNYTHFGRLDTTWQTIGNLMKAAGYRTCISGKWQLNGLAYKDQFPDWDDPGRPLQMGFEEYCLWQLTHQRSEGERYADPLIEENGRVLETGPSDYGPDLFCNYILDFIERNSKEPFFVYYPMVLVHDPFVPTPDSEDWNDPQNRYRSDTAYFRDMVAYADKQVGRIRRKLVEEGIEENTILIFTADNGTDRSVRSHTRTRMVRGGKGMTISDGIHVPLLVSWPEKIRKGRRYEGLIEFSDFYPTLADLVNTPVESDGKSFLPVLENRKHESREFALVHYDPRWGDWVNRHRNRFIQNTGYKLYQDGSFFHIEEDILEQHPLAERTLNTDQEELKSRMKQALFDLPETPPNLVLIITDDQGYGDLSLHGNPILETPHLDAIGINGVRLDNFHVSPVCAPTRAALLTGRRPMSTGGYYVTRGGETMDAEEYTLAEILSDHGYSTACFGKWHNGAHHPHHPLSQGFDEFLGFTAGHWNNYFDPELEHNGRMIRTEGYIADIFTDRAIDFIREKQNEPFFCYLAYNTPHSPFQVPDPYFDMYIDKVTDPDSALRIMNASVFGMVRNIDDNVGRLMNTLKELDLEENTVVVFLTDNGPNTQRFNGDMKGRKGWVNDGGVRVPCFIQWKGHLPAGKVIHSTTAHIDLLPTLTGMMGIDFEPVRELHGMDLSGRIMGMDREQDRFVFTHVNRGLEIDPLPGAVRTAGWRLVANSNGSLELTRREDKQELRNLADSLPELTDSLLGSYHSWFEPLESRKVPPIPVGVIDSVVIPAHEGFLSGSATYFWSSNGWSNDWVHDLDMQASYVYWPLNITATGEYQCYVNYACASGSASISLQLSDIKIDKELSVYVPVADRNYSRIDRSAEAIGQTWKRENLGMLQLTEGADTLVVRASSPDLELLSVVLTGR
jgi:arylsulfatase A